MAPRKSNESDKEKNDYSSENEADIEDENSEENELIKKSNGKESSDEKNSGNVVEEEKDEESNEENENVEEENGSADEDDEALIKKRKAGKPLAKKKKASAAKANPKKKRSVKVTEDEEPVEEYEVKEVIDSKKEKNVLYYLIRWKGYTAADDTWERATDLSCDDLIASYIKKNQNKKTAQSATKQPPKKRKKEEEEDADPEKEYEVEKIISILETKKGNVFRIRWKGFRSTQDTWEPEENLNCKDLIEKFLKKHKDQLQFSSKSLREEPKRTKRLVNETKNPRARSSKRSSAKAR
ncbi:hypothetical protein ACFFRR_001119 [Megaselia abdita]